MSTGLQRTAPHANHDGGARPYRSLSVLATGLIVKASKGTLYSIDAININATVRYLKIYDKATAATEADTPKMTVQLLQGSRFLSFPMGLRFDNGICIRATTELADAGTTAPSANETIVNLSYQ